MLLMRDILVVNDEEDDLHDYVAPGGREERSSHFKSTPGCHIVHC